MANYLIAQFLAVGVSALSCAAVKSPVSTRPVQTPVSQDVSFKTSDLTLQGTLEVPAGSGKFPAMLLLPGSGPTNRDGNSPKLKVTTDVLKDIADNLAKHGIATLRFDKRAIDIYASSWPKTPSDLNKYFGWNKFVVDAKAALSFLESQPQIDPQRVGMLGHSEGALISLQVASDLNGQPGAPKALVLLGSTGRPMGAVLHEQIARLLKNQGATPEVGKPFLDYTDAACSALAAGKPLPPNTPQGLLALFNPMTEDIVGAYCRIDPCDLAKAFTGPVLVINGQNDTQVSAERDTPRLVDALKSRSAGSVDSFIAPDASHNLKSTNGGQNDDAFQGDIVPGVLDRIDAFCASKL